TLASSAPVTVTSLGVALGGTFALPPGVHTAPSGLPITGDVSPTIVGTAPAGWAVAGGAPPRGGGGAATAAAAGRVQGAIRPMPRGALGSRLPARTPAGDALGSKLVLQAPVGALIIDTPPPRVQAVTLARRAGEILITFLDSGAGLDPDGLLSASTYAVSRPARRRSSLQPIASVLDLGPTAKPGTRRIALVLNGGRPLRARRYLLTIHSGRIQDLAGLALDGEFRGRLPSGNGAPGGDFVAVIDASGRLMPSAGAPHRTRARPTA